MTRARTLDGRVAVVTGAGRGLGRAHALTLAREGARVVVNDLGVTMGGEGTDASVARAVADEIAAAGGQAVANDDDAASFDGAAAIIATAIDAFGRIDILVNNAGIVADAPIEELSESLLLKLINVHYIGTVGTVKAAFALMRAQRYGRIVNTVSEAALDPRSRGGVAYGAAKGAVWAATLAMAREAAGTGVTVNGLSPGGRTRMNERLFAERPPTLDLSPEHVARVVAVLVSEAAGDINGRIVHAAAGAIREYEVRRTAETDLVARLQSAVTALES